ncbi:glycosyltransferase family protein [Methylobacterium sp. Leaf113]|uniref:glycosyltransferase family protein n=1 Tax=Methylobacterium sp. Leaf113 TaxID=1736259 RepID=UPI000ACB0805|nr:hypothetical protein [Methylobacterium sp. Leaf113]
MKAVRIGVVGHFVWFANHFPEGWRTDSNVLCLDVDEGDYSFLVHLINFRPDITLFYRPELYPKRYIDAISGLKIGILSEPVPATINEQLLTSSETDLRMRVYSNMNWDAYHKLIYYDVSKRETIERLGWPIDSFHPLPIDTDLFNPRRRDRPIDVCFVGKATAHRIEVLDFLRLAPVRFVWVAHGTSGRELAWLFRRSKVVINIHADALPALEPRILLAAACGCIVLSEPIPGEPWPFNDRVHIFGSDFGMREIKKAIAEFESTVEDVILSERHLQLSTRGLIHREMRD